MNRWLYKCLNCLGIGDVLWHGHGATENCFACGKPTEPRFKVLAQQQAS